MVRTFRNVRYLWYFVQEPGTQYLHVYGEVGGVLTVLLPDWVSNHKPPSWLGASCNFLQMLSMLFLIWQAQTSL